MRSGERETGIGEKFIVNGDIDLALSEELTSTAKIKSSIEIDIGKPLRPQHLVPTKAKYVDPQRSIS